MNRYISFLLTLLIVNVCLADNAIVPLPDAADSQPVRRNHYVNPPIPIPVPAIPQEKKLQNIPLDLKQDSPTAWSLDQVITAVLTSDPKLRIGKEDIRQANAEYLTNSLLPNPAFTTEGGTLPFRHDRITPDTPGGPPELNLQVEFPIDWFLFAKRKAAMESAQWEVRQAQAEYADLIRGRIMETATLFYDVLEAKALLAVAKQDMDILTQLEQIAKAGVEAGGMPPVELKRISLDLFQSRQEVLEAEKTVDVLKSQLRSQFGSTGYDSTFDITGNLDAETDRDPMPLESAFAMAQQNRPDIRALRMQVSKSKADVYLEKRNAHPEVTAFGGYTRQYQKALGDDNYNGWGIGVTLTVPLFDRNQGNRLKARSALAQSTHQYQAGIVDLHAEIVEADRNFRTAHQQVHTIAAEEIRLSTEVRDMMVAAFKAGGCPLIDVLDAERSHRETYRMFMTSRADYWRAMYIYNSVVGVDSYDDVRASGH